MFRALLASIVLFSMPLLMANKLQDNPNAVSTRKVYTKKHKKAEYQVAKYKVSDLEKIHYKKELRIETCLQDRYGIRVGLQTIYYGNKAISESDKMHSVQIGNKEYVVHIHPYMTVYSRDKIQHIVLKK